MNAALSSSLDSNTTVSVIGSEYTKETLTVDIQYSFVLAFDTHVCKVWIFINYCFIGFILQIYSANCHHK